MANLKASIKDIRKTKTRTQYNKRIKRRVKVAMKTLDGALTSGNTEEAKSLYVRTQKMLDKAAKKGIIKKGAASRRKSRLARKINQTAANVQTAETNS